MGEEPLDELPPEMAAAWREREAEAAIAPDEVVPTEEKPPEAEVPAEPIEPRRRSPLVAFAVLPVVVVAVLGAKVLGLAGWRGGAALTAAGLTIAALAVGLLLTRGQNLRVAYVGGALVLALIGSAWCVSTAPLSHGRLEQVLDRLPDAALAPTSTTRSGHGWCRPRCPTVTRTYVLAGRQPSTAMRIAIAAMSTPGLIPNDAGRVAYSRALAFASTASPVSIDNQRYTTVVRVTPDSSAEAVGGSRLTLEITSRRGVRERPLSPARAR